ncbi:MAG: hypothetical protein JNM93_11120 [Bacteriovoracaceae bacterium]|nr:hypothetical protein [Bacteriovoracaceae bacterium]
MRNYLFVLLFISSVAQALEVDEKLTMRILKVSDSRKTILINRGEEDGLAKGDHAKFFMTSGVVARGMLVKLAPTRSIWSLYRLVNADTIANDTVMNLKITPAVKVTDDDSKMLLTDDTPQRVGNADPNALGIPLAQGAQDLDAPLSSLERAELSELRTKILDKDIGVKKVEIFASLQFSRLGSKVENSNASTSVSDSSISTDLFLGGEYYFKVTQDWYSKFTVSPFMHMINNQQLQFNGTSVSTSVTEFGANANYYFNGEHSKAETFIPFATAGFAIGSVKDTVAEGAGTFENTGSTSSISMGAGLKYHTFRGYGLRLVGDYYSRSESLGEVAATPGVTWSRTSSGFRFLMGLSYRF